MRCETRLHACNGSTKLNAPLQKRLTARYLETWQAHMPRSNVVTLNNIRMVLKPETSKHGVPRVLSFKNLVDVVDSEGRKDVQQC